MNGNLTIEGITADLEVMRKAGIGGVTIVNVDCEITAWQWNAARDIARAAGRLTFTTWHHYTKDSVFLDSGFSKSGKTGICGEKNNP